MGQNLSDVDLDLLSLLGAAKIFFLGMIEESYSLICGVFVCIFALFVMQKRAMTGGEDTRATRPGGLS